MVKLQEVEDEHFTEKTGTTKKDALLESDNDDDYTDTGMTFLYDLNLGTSKQRQLKKRLASKAKLCYIHSPTPAT